MYPFKPYQPKANGPVQKLLTTEDAEAVALLAVAFVVLAVAFVVTDDELLQHFLAITGSDVEGLRLRVADRNFLVGVLDFLLADDNAVLAFSKQNGIAPETPMQARERLSAAT